MLRIKCMQKRNGLLLTRLDYQPLFGKWKAGPDGAAEIKLLTGIFDLLWLCNVNKCKLTNCPRFLKKKTKKKQKKKKKKQKEKHKKSFPVLVTITPVLVTRVLLAQTTRSTTAFSGNRKKTSCISQ